MRRRFLATALVLILAGCADQPPPTAAPSSSATSAPFPSVDEATTLPLPTIVPTPPLTGDGGQWTALDWRAPVPTKPLEDVADVIAWNGVYIAVGQFQNDQGGLQAAAWISADWSSWHRTLLDAPPAGSSSLASVLEVGSRLVAIGSSGAQHCVPPEGEGQRCDPLPIAMWSSTDGQSWEQEAAAPVLDGATIASAVAGAGGMILVGDKGWDEPRIWASVDGTQWQAVALPAEVFANAHFVAVAAIADGWVLTGSVGGSEPVCCIGTKSDTVPAAWFSSDGVTWHKAAVLGAAGAIGDQIGPVFVGADGMIAAGQGEVSRGWGSTDGRTWTAAAPQPDNPIFAQASDGRRIIGSSFAPDDRVAMWVSSDGATWSPLTALGAADRMPSWSADTGPTADVDVLFPDALGLVGQDATGRTLMWLAKGVVGP